LARASSAFVTSSVVSGGAHELPQLPPHPNFAFHSPPPPRLLRGEHELHDSLDLRLRRTEGEPSDDDGARGRSSLDPRRPRAGEMPSALRRPGDTPGETPGERPPPPLPKLPPPPPPVPLAAAAAACRPPQKLTERGSSPPRSAEAAEEDLCQGTVAGKRQEGKRQEGRRVGGQAGRRAGWRGGGVAGWRGGGAAASRRYTLGSGRCIPAAVRRAATHHKWCRLRHITLRRPWPWPRPDSPDVGSGGLSGEASRRFGTGAEIGLGLGAEAPAHPE